MHMSEEEYEALLKKGNVKPQKLKVRNSTKKTNSDEKEVVPQETIFLSLPFEPVGKGRPRFHRVGDQVQTYTPTKTQNFEDTIKQWYALEYGHVLSFDKDTPLTIEINAVLGVPQSNSKKEKALKYGGFIPATKKPDVDNILKIVLDALNKTAFYDDKQIIQIYCFKRYETEGEGPHLDIKISKASLSNAA